MGRQVLCQVPPPAAKGDKEQKKAQEGAQENQQKGKAVEGDVIAFLRSHNKANKTT